MNQSTEHRQSVCQLGNRINLNSKRPRRSPAEHIVEDQKENAHSTCNTAEQNQNVDFGEQ
jgi:hypothetical protein